MIAKLVSATIVVLILLPFTAPFSTCDFSHGLTHASRHGRVTARATVNDTDAALISPRVSTGRARLSPTTHARVSDTGTASPVSLAPSEQSIAPSSQQPQRLVVLRV